jgi:hypothetical protein
MASLRLLQATALDRPRLLSETAEGMDLALTRLENASLIELLEEVHTMQIELDGLMEQIIHTHRRLLQIRESFFSIQ